MQTELHVVVVDHARREWRSGRRGRSRPSGGSTGPSAAWCGSRASGERLAWKSSMPISAGVCRFQPGSVKSRRHVAAGAVGLAEKTCLPRPRRRGVKLPRGGGGRGECQLVDVQGRRAWGVTRSGSLRTLPKPARAAIGNCAASFSRGSKNVPLPCISRFATKAFQYVTEPQPVQVCRLTPGETEGGRNERCRGLAVGAEALAVEEQLGVELARAPARRAPCAPWPRRRRSRSATG